MKTCVLLIITSFTLLDLFEKVVSADSSIPYDAIFNFGDSLSDTGNFLATGDNAFLEFKRLPYGETFFQRPVGRFSDGRLAIDFLAQAYGLPYLPPYLTLIKGQNISQGVNFAVAGATAVDAKYFLKKGIGPVWTNNSLTVQVGWFKKLKPSLCNTKEACDRYFSRTLFVVGEIGGNDHNYVATATRNVSRLPPMVSIVIEAIAKATTELINEGAVELMIPGNLPSGCSAMYLTTFLSKKKEDYDEHGCFKALNDFVMSYNNQLLEAIQILRRNNPRARIIYGDYYGAALRFFHAPNHYGFSGETLSACCGGGGPYNVNVSAGCGSSNSKVCQDPSTFANWDGIHLTEAANKFLAKGLIEGPFTKPPLKPPPFKIP